ncbi:polysaccharide deacetylase family protein [Bdellovibrionota bacterium FG-2]
MSRIRLFLPLILFCLLTLLTSACATSPAARGVASSLDTHLPLRARLLVPPYLWRDSEGGEVDNIKTFLDQWGIPSDAPAHEADWQRDFDNLDRYSLVIVPGYLYGSILGESQKQALEKFVQSGGILVLLKPIGETPSDYALDLAGLLQSRRRLDVTSIQFYPEKALALRSFDRPEELAVPLQDATTVESTEVFTLEPDLSKQTQSVAVAQVGDKIAGAVLTRRPLGRGSVYALGHDLHTFIHYRCYINCFEPSGDLIGLFLRGAFWESTQGHVALKHTVPGSENSVVLMTHDIDAPDSHRSGKWGKPGALQVAEVEKELGVTATFNITTDYVTKYYNPDTLKKLCALGMCPLGAHSVLHSMDFAKLPRGTCAEAAPAYGKQSSAGETLCGEVGVSTDLITQSTGMRPRVFRAPYLLVHPELFDVLAEKGFVADSSFAVEDYKFNLPFSIDRIGLRSDLFHHRPIVEFPISCEDGMVTSRDGGKKRTELQASNLSLFLDKWKSTIRGNAANGAFTTILVHPSFGLGVGPENMPIKIKAVKQILSFAQDEGLKIETMERIADFWRARESTDLSVGYESRTGYSGTLTIGDLPIQNLTLEFGESIENFVCEKCGTFRIAGNRVVLESLLPAKTSLRFTAR